MYKLKLKTGAEITLTHADDVTRAMNSIRVGLELRIRYGDWRGTLIPASSIDYLSPDLLSSDKATGLVYLPDGSPEKTSFDVKAEMAAMEKTSAYELIPVEIGGAWVLTKGPEKAKPTEPVGEIKI